MCIARMVLTDGREASRCLQGDGCASLLQAGGPPPFSLRSACDCCLRAVLYWCSAICRVVAASCRSSNTRFKPVGGVSQRTAGQKSSALIQGIISSIEMNSNIETICIGRAVLVELDADRVDCVHCSGDRVARLGRVYRICACRAIPASSKNRENPTHARETRNMESDHGSEQGLGEGREGQQRDMVAPASRALWERIDASKGPGITGKQEDWKASNFKLMSFMKDHGLDKTMTGKDPDKESEDEHKQANYKRRDGIVFTTLTRQISEASIEGKTLLTEVMEKFGEDQSGEELYNFIVEKMTSLTTEDIRAKKSVIKEFSLRSPHRLTSQACNALQSLSVPEVEYG
eukprot:5102668-Prymnesium_polylepis.2